MTQIERVIIAEREECAKLAANAKSGQRLQYCLMSKDAADGYRLACDDIEGQIRARSES